MKKGVSICSDDNSCHIENSKESEITYRNNLLPFFLQIVASFDEEGALYSYLDSHSNI